MKYSILGFNQSMVCDISKTIVDKSGKYKILSVDVIDLLIVKELADFMNRTIIIKHTIEDKTFFSIRYDAILEDLPILNIKKQALRDRIDKICELGIIEKKVVRNETGSWTAFRMGKLYEQLKYSTQESFGENVGECSKLHKGVYSTTQGCVANYTPKYYNTITNIKEEDTKVSSKKYDYKAIVDCWNESNGKKISMVTKVTKRREKAIKKQLEDNGITQEQLMSFFKTLPFADSWLYNPNKQHKNWKPDFDWWLANTNGWLTKGLEGKVHNENPQVFAQIMGGELSTTYAPPTDGSIKWNEPHKCYIYIGMFFGYIPDGYTDDNRPNGARIMLNNKGVFMKWNGETKLWEEE